MRRKIGSINSESGERLFRSCNSGRLTYWIRKLRDKTERLTKELTDSDTAWSAPTWREGD
jgi:hypothetical protein